MKKRNIVRPNGLKGKDKLNRMRELMGGTSINENVNRYVVELTKMGPDGKVYGIVRENQEYYIKVTNKTKNIIAEDFQYMGGLMNKKSKSFPSYAKAIKNLNLKFMSLKESIGESGQVNIFKNDNLLKEHHPLKSDMKLSDTKAIGDGQEYVVNEKGSELSYDNKEGKEKDGFGDNVAKKDSMKELEDVKMNENELRIDSILAEMMDDEPEELPKEIKDKFDAEDEAEYQERLADEYFSSMEAHEDPDHVPFEYGIEESIKNLVNKVNDRIKKKSEVNSDSSVLNEMRFDGKDTGLFSEEQKYVLQVDAPEKKEDVFDDDSLDSLDDIDLDVDMSDSKNDKPFDDKPFDAGVEADEDEDPEKFIQQLAGKIGTSLRSFTSERGEPDLELEKYVVNSVISATHTSEMDEEDQKDIIKKVKMAGAGSDVDDKNVKADEDEKPEEEEMDIDVEMDDSEGDSKDELTEGDFSDLFKARTEMYKKDPKMAEAMDFINMHGRKIKALYNQVKGFDLIDFAFFIYFNAKDLVFDPKMNEIEKELHESANIFKHLSLKKKREVSKGLAYHLNKNLPLNESIYRYGSKGFFDLFIEATELYESGDLIVNNVDDLELISSNIGSVDIYEGNKVYLNVPYLNEAEYKGKKVDLNKPKRNTGEGKKYYVYVKDPKTNNVKKVMFGDKKGGLTAKVSDPEARKSFASRHKCSEKKDKTKPGYWSCRLTKFGHLFGGKTYPGYW